MKFSKNWNNKLDCKYFTTIRKYDYKKYLWYQDQVGETIPIYLEDKEVFKAKLLSVQIIRLSTIKTIIKILDTGSLNWENIFKNFGIQKTDTVLLFLLEKEEKNADKL